jgi:putative endonuclease
VTACWSVYLVRRADGALYCGIAIDVARRLAEHAAGRGAKALRGRGPLQLVLRRRVGDRGLALRVEARIKRLHKSEKERLVRAPRSAFARLLAGA